MKSIHVRAMVYGVGTLLSIVATLFTIYYFSDVFLILFLLGVAYVIGRCWCEHLEGK